MRITVFSNSASSKSVSMAAFSTYRRRSCVAPTCVPLPLFTQESNDLAAEADALAAEKDRVVKEINGNMQKTDALNDLIRYVGHAQASPDFDGDLVERFLESATMTSRNKVVFHLKCGLSLAERIGEK